MRPRSLGKCIVSTFGVDVGVYLTGVAILNYVAIAISSLVMVLRTSKV